MKDQKKVGLYLPQQQGFVLVLALLLMLFTGVVLVTSAERTGQERRVAISRAHLASLHSAVDAGVSQIQGRIQLVAAGESREVACNHFMQEVNSLASQVHSYMQASPGNPAIWWQPDASRFSVDCSSIEDDQDEIVLAVKAWQGSEDQSQVIAERGMTMQVTFQLNPDSQTGAGSDPVAAAFGENAAGSWGRVEVTGGGRIEGNVTADEVSLNGGASIYANDEKAQIATAFLNKPDWMQLDKAEQTDSYTALDSDPLGLQARIDGLEIDAASIQDLKSELGNKNVGQWGAGQVIFSAAGATNLQGDAGDLEVLKQVDFLGRESLSLYALDELRLVSGGQGNPSFGIGHLVDENGDLFCSEEASQASHVLIYVAGDVHFGGGTSLEICENSSLTLVVEGTTRITAGFNFMNEQVLNTQGQPIFSLYSNYSHNSPNATAVKISGGAHLLGAVYAAQASIDISGGSYIRGQALGPEVKVSGGTGIYYESLTAGGGGGQAGETYVPDADINFDFDYD
ncbi:DUF7305 domain-containing protein [Marinospirillum perlucidum]|uniref:DUF7305 domain-containing protein n=1 Tax=Marinospirillum perlucidum TaxID=1982602 RepID=UPI000DF43AB8|nr:hypothetical protein [Marinospirillum perlucidum]